MASDEQKMTFVPSRPLPAARTGLLTEFKPGTQTLVPGYQLEPRFRPISGEIVFEKDVAVTLRDGVTIYVDVFRPAGTEQVPVIVAWSPYGKSHGSSPMVLGLLGMLGLDNSARSGLEKFEGPDPAYWCAKGYAVCNPDPRGIAHSEGDSAMFGPPGGGGLPRPHRVAGRAGVEQRQGRDERHVLPRGRAVVHRGRAAAAPRRDQPVGGLQRHLPRPRDARRHAGHRLRRAPAEAELHGAEPARGHPGRGGGAPPGRRPLGGQDPTLRAGHRPGVRRGQLLQHPAHGRHVPRLATDRLDRQVAARPQHAGVARLLPRGERRGPAPLLRPLPQGRGQRLGADRTGPLQPPRPRGRRQRGPRGHRVPAHRRDAR